jgi:hypothetical protein
MRGEVDRDPVADLLDDEGQVLGRLARDEQTVVGEYLGERTRA